MLSNSNNKRESTDLKRFGFMQFVLFVLFVAALTQTPASAGVDSSGGAELVGDKQNPWFVENTPDVTYCVDVDGGRFSQSADELARFVERALGFWQRQFELVQENGYSFKLGTQRFRRQTPCAADVDVAFQFGRLQAGQGTWLSDPPAFVGVAVRTAYDPKTLRGRGFIYISPDNGPLRFRGEDLLPDPWTRESGARLYQLLVHETGHIFGLPHMGPPESLTGTTFPDRLVRPYPHQQDEKSFRLDRTPEVLAFDYVEPRIQCGFNAQELRTGLRYLEVSDDCLKFVFRRNAGFDLLQAPSREGPWEQVGTFEPDSQESSDISASGFVTIYLTPGNSVMPLPTRAPERLGVLGAKETGGSGFYTAHRTDARKALRIVLLPGGLAIGGIVDGRIDAHLLHVFDY
jgi:hypothetical protein